MNDYFEYLYHLITKHELSDEEVEYSQSLYRKLMNRDYMENGRSTTGASEGLLEMIKTFHKWSDKFYDKHRFLLTDILETNDIDFLEESDFENKT